MQLSCNYVHGFKLPSMFFDMFQSHVITNRAMIKPVFLVEHGPKVWDRVLRLCIF